MNDSKIKVLMCGSDFSVKGGMVSVAKNYVNYSNWNNVEIKYVSTHKDGSIFTKIIYFVLSYLKILITCLTEKIDIAHLHMAERGSMKRKRLIMQLCHLFKIKVIIHHHGGFFDEEYEKMNENQRKKIKKLLKDADLNIVLSKTLIEPMKKKCKDAKITYLYNAVNLPSTNQYNFEAKNILFLGKICKEKGIYDLLDAIKLVDNQLDKNTKLYICGAGEEKEILNYIKKIGLENRIKKIGWINEIEREEIFKDCYVNILPSYYERLPMTILEAMSYGVPCISTNIASLPEVITNNENGFLVNPGEKEKIARLLLDKKNIALKSQKAYETIKNQYSIDHHIKQVEKIYKKMKE